jgi:hypothetical protein
MTTILMAVLFVSVTTPSTGAYLILNEYNAVDSDKYLNGGDASGQDADTFFGRVEGNGGDWFELVVIADHLDVRGWSMEIVEDGSVDTVLRFTDHPLWSDLRSGTIITVGEDLPDDPSYAPDSGDWWIHVQANRKVGTGLLIIADNFRVTNNEWQLTIQAASGALVFGPTGEGISPPSGVGSKEVFKLEADPDAGITEISPFYDDGISSTFGAPNRWDGGSVQQDFGILRTAGLPGTDADEDGIFDDLDNCQLIANSDQRDTDGDGIGNRCDPDFNGDGFVDYEDLNSLLSGIASQDCRRPRISSYCANLDLNDDGRVGVRDLWVLAAFLFQPPGPGVVLPEDLSEILYDPERVILVDIEINADDWEALRVERRTLTSILGGDCLAEPFVSPFNWYSATVTVDGEKIENAGIRKKGFLGSLDSQRPSLKIHLDRFLKGQKVHGVHKITLNNSLQDPAFVRQCIGYELFSRAGIPASRCNFAHVYVNGQDFGLYVNVEQVRKPLLRRHYLNSGGNLYEGELSDFHPDWVNTFDRETNESDPDRSDLDAVVAALQGPTHKLLEKLDPIVDLENFITFWAMEGLIAGIDGYTGDRNNFFVYHEPVSNKFVFLPWGLDIILTPGAPFANPSPDAPTSVYTYSTLAHRLYQLPSVRQRYKKTVWQLLDSVWDEEAILSEIDRMQALIEHVAGDLSEPLDELRNFVRDRRTEVVAELNGAPPEINVDPEDPICFIPNGNIVAEFTAVWGDLEAIVGTATMDGHVDGMSLESVAVSATGGLFKDDPNPNFGAIQILFPLEDGAAGVIFLTMNPALLVSGSVLNLDGVAAEGILAIFPAGAADPSVLMYMDGGVIEIMEANIEPGGTVSGQLESTTAIFPRMP